jgi:hypothetical protein
MSSDGPDQGDWINPSQPAAPPAVVPPVSVPASSPGGWGTPAPPPPPAYGWPSQPGTPYGWTPGAPQAPKPGVVPLRPLGVGELLDGAFTTIRRYPAATLGLSAVVMLFVVIMQIFIQYSLLHGVARDTTTAFGTTQTNGDYAARLVTAQLIVLIVTSLATVLLTGMLTTVAGQAVLGRPMSMRAAWDGTRPLFWRLLGVTLLIALILVVIGVAGALPGLVVLVAGSTRGGVVLIVIGLLGAFVAMVYVWTSLIMSTPALILEKLTVLAALSRSRRLVSGSWWRTFGIFLLASIIAGVISGIVTVPFQLAGGLGSALSGHPGDQYHFVPLLLTGIGTFLGGTLVRPFSASVIALLYIDRRMRAEALDLTLQQAAANNPS